MKIVLFEGHVFYFSKLISMIIGPLVRFYDLVIIFMVAYDWMEISESYPVCGEVLIFFALFRDSI